MNVEPGPLTVAVRAYPLVVSTKTAKNTPGRRRPRGLPDAMLVFDTETRTDASQALLFGCWRYHVGGRCLEEGLFYPDELTAAERLTLEEYSGTHASAAAACDPRLPLITLAGFLEKLYRAAYKGRCLVVGFNLPFDLSRVAFDAVPARGRFAGGFSLGLWAYAGEGGRLRRNQYRPRIGIKAIDSKRALKGFTARNEPDRVDMIPEGSQDRTAEPGYVFRGHFLDLRTLAFALTDRGHTLESACKDFGVEHGKQQAVGHGKITPEYVDYCRRDVLATAELACKLVEEYARHPIDLQATKAYSPASIGKAYLRAMGIEPILARQPDFPTAYLGYAQSAFYGGRAGARIRKVPVPVVYCDFLSMYPTVNSLLGLWRFVIATRIEVIERCQAEVETFLRGLSADGLFDLATWPRLVGFVKLVPDGDVLPLRAKYSSGGSGWQIGVNHVHGGEDAELWYSLPDVAASVILTGRVPKIVDAFRLEPRGRLAGLTPVKLRGAVGVDPVGADFFRVVIEERRRVGKRANLPPEERSRLDKFLKVLANAASYGIYAEMNPQESDKPVKVTCHGIDAEPFTCRVAHPDVPGEYCFPPLAALITGAARLMLALLEQSITALGGVNAMEDTDSMAIVATESGGMVVCPGGPHRMADGREAVKALSWAEVAGIARRFEALNPYDPAAIPGSVLKIETDNFDDAHRQRQLWCLAISAKRYALFTKDAAGDPALAKWSEHGLGHLLNPTDPGSADRDWIRQVWEGIVRRSLSFATADPPFANVPALGRITVSSPVVLRPMLGLNAGNPYSEQIKPFNFLLTAHVMPFGHPTGADAARFHLFAPYESDPRRWLALPWTDQYSGKRFRVTTTGVHGSRKTARIKTYGDVVLEYEHHPEPKAAGPDGAACRRDTIGLLQQRHVQIGLVKYIGKESNRLEAVEAGLEHEEADVYTEYPDPRHDEWTTVILPAIRRMPIRKVRAATGLSKQAIVNWRAGRSRPRAETLEAVVKMLRGTRP